MTKLHPGAVAFAALILGAAGQASAQTCAADGDCPQGHACSAIRVDDEPEAPPCPRGAECASPDASATPTVVKMCEAKSCTADADCGPGMVCFAQMSTECSGGAAVAPCAPNQPCDAGPPPKREEQCTTRTTKTCAFTWQLPCHKDSDCGTGFTCRPAESGRCSGSSGGGSTGSGGSGGTRADDDPAPGVPRPPADGGMGTMTLPPPMCTTMTSYPGWCQPRVTTCTVDADCPAHWKCAADPDTPVSNGGSRFAPPPAADAGAPAKKVCVSSLAPPQRGGTAEGTPTAPGGGNGGPGSDDKAPPPAPVPGGGGGAQDAGAPPEGAKNVATSKSGCTMTAGAAPSSAGLIAAVSLLGLALARVRARRR